MHFACWIRLLDRAWLPFALATSRFWPVITFFSHIGNENVTTWCANFIVTFSYPIGYKKWQQVKTFHLSKINSISCTFTLFTMRKINTSIRNAAYYALICCNNLLWQFVVAFCCDNLLSQFLWRKRKPFWVTPEEGAKANSLQAFNWKKHENERYWTEGVHVPAPPWICQRLYYVCALLDLGHHAPLKVSLFPDSFAKIERKLTCLWLMQNLCVRSTNRKSWINIVVRHWRT